MAPSYETIGDKSFQDKTENALSDQVHAAIKMKKLYNIIDAAFALPAVELMEKSEEGYIGYRDIYFYKDMLVVKPQNFYSKRVFLDYRMERIRLYESLCPDTEFYIYYIETDKDINFETGEKSGFYEYMQDSLPSMGQNFARLETGSYEDYRLNFLGTDHHWNGTGAYSAYLDICGMMGLEPINSQGMCSIDGRYLGTRAAGVEGVAPESFTVNIFEYPQMDIIINGSDVSDYGMQQDFIDGTIQSISYGSVYGPDCKEIIFDTGREGDNLLVMGDSYDNAILKSLASGFTKTYSIDLRAHSADSFDLSTYVQTHEIDKVLFIGGIDYFSTILY